MTLPTLSGGGLMFMDVRVFVKPSAPS